MQGKPDVVGSDTYKTQMTVFGVDTAVWPLAFTAPFPFCCPSCVAMVVGRRVDSWVQLGVSSTLERQMAGEYCAVLYWPR